MKTTDTKFALTNIILSNVTAINELFEVQEKDRKTKEIVTKKKPANPFQRLLLFTICDLMQKRLKCNAKYSYIAKRLGVSENYVSEGITFWKNNGYLKVSTSLKNDGKFTKQNTITPTNKLLEVLSDKYYIKNQFANNDIVPTNFDNRSHDDYHRDSSDLTYNKPLNTETPNSAEPLNKKLFTSDPEKIATQFLSDANASDDQLLPEIEKEEKKEVPIHTVTTNQFYGCENLDFLQLSDTIIKMAEQDSISAYKLSSDEIKIKDLLQKLGINLNGEFQDFIYRFKPLAQDYFLTNFNVANKNTLNSSAK